MRPLPRTLVQSRHERYRRAHRSQVPPMRHDQQPEAHEARNRAPGASIRRGRMWLYIPPEDFNGLNISPASRSARGSAGLSSGSPSQNPDIGLWVTSSETHSRRPLSWRGWATRPWIGRLSGVTLPPSTAARGAARWISSLPAIPASRLPSAAAGRALRTRGTSGRMSGALRRKSALARSSARMSRDTSLWAFPSSPGTYGQWVTSLGRACSQRQKQARAILGAGSSFWPTPLASVCGNRAEIVIDEQGFRFRPDLSQGNQVGLANTAGTWTRLWLLVKAAGFRAGPAGNFPFPLPVRVNLRAGSKSLPGELIFNPAFSDWMMGWPIGWSDPGQVVTGFTPWLRRSRGLLLRLTYQANKPPFRPPSNRL